MKVLHEQFRQLNWLRKIDPDKKIYKQNKTKQLSLHSLGIFKHIQNINYLSVFV